MTLEEQFKQETGKTAAIHFSGCKYYPEDFIEWFIKKHDLEKARRVAAEELLIECKETIEYLKHYVEGGGLSAEDDANEIIDKINNFVTQMDPAPEVKDNE